MRNNKVFNMILAALFASIIAITAQISVPIGIVPATMQPTGVLLTGLILGKKWGSISTSIYVLMGAIGLPVYAGGASGFGALFGPTGGYLFGFIAVAFVIGFIHERKQRNFFSISIAVITGAIVMLVLGMTWLKIFTGMSFLESFAVGIVPFILPNTLQIVLVIAVGMGILKRLPKRMMERIGY
ncbi:MAG: biotin transporter BioY [Streptococcaceae bacterium]|jgi:biotin transport system substrate-specific component|nr:biotin transporter BioY [Streptococcaceae bacterium]